MKTKTIILLAISAVALFSFTFASVKESANKPVQEPVSQAQSNEPIGGFVSEDKF